MIVWMDDILKHGRKIGCTDCGLEDFLSDYEAMTWKELEFKHECKKLLGKSGDKENG